MENQSLLSFATETDRVAQLTLTSKPTLPNSKTSSGHGDISSQPFWRVTSEEPNSNTPENSSSKYNLVVKYHLVVNTSAVEKARWPSLILILRSPVLPLSTMFVMSSSGTCCQINSAPENAQVGAPKVGHVQTHVCSFVCIFQISPSRKLTFYSLDSLWYITSIGLTSISNSTLSLILLCSWNYLRCWWPMHRRMFLRQTVRNVLRHK